MVLAGEVRGLSGKPVYHHGPTVVWRVRRFQDCIGENIQHKAKQKQQQTKQNKQTNTKHKKQSNNQTTKERKEKKKKKERKENLDMR